MAAGQPPYSNPKQKPRDVSQVKKWAQAKADAPIAEGTMTSDSPEDVSASGDGASSSSSSSSASLSGGVKPSFPRASFAPKK